jgi:hypothetical protein
MLKTFGRAFGAAFALVLLGGLVANAVIQNTAPQGPYLGDANVNLYTLLQAITQDNQDGFTPTYSVSQTSGQANCTNLVSTTPMHNITTSAGTGYICLPTAFAGRQVFIGNSVSGQTIDIYSNATSYTSGTADTINGTAGTTAYTGLTTGKNAQCFAPANGAWFCSSGS